MRIDIVTLHPTMFAPLESSIIGRAREKGLVDINIVNLRDFGLGRYRQVDDTPYGGGAGMVMCIQPIDDCIGKLKSERDYDEVRPTACP